MKARLAYAAVLMSGALLLAQETDRPESAPAFRSMDLYFDVAGQALAAYQVEVVATRGRVRFVGIEGGEPPAFRSPPFYDPKALRGKRLILAAYHLETTPPTGRVRVATLHVQIASGEPAQFAVNVHTAANAAGRRIPATAALVERNTE
ncbi:MAG: hypothetical protein JXQ71_03670 [Verrucomicrobia bacterium]|nr:hypothetical protein [Verrucomicrobiota bacterium]